MSFVDISNTSGVVNIKSSRRALPGRTAAPGMNIECKCECTLYRVICMRRFGAIELSQAQLQCPICQKSNRIEPINVGFVQCKYRFHGIKATGQQYSSEWKSVAEEGVYQCFDSAKQTLWARLVIESAKLNECDDMCAVCLEPMYIIKKLVCGHRFHSRCLAKWKLSCPQCRFNQHLVSG